MFNIFLKCNKSDKRNKNNFSLLISVFAVFPHLTFNLLISILFSRKYKNLTAYLFINIVFYFYLKNDFNKIKV